MRLVYFDEAGSSQDEQQEPVITVAAVVLHGDLQTLPVERDVEDVRRTYVPDSYGPNFEFHAKELFSSSERLKGWERAGRHSALRAFLGLIRKHNLPVLHASIDKPGLRKALGDEAQALDWKTWPHQATFQLASLQVEHWFRRNANYERGFCIADETKAKPFLKTSFRNMRSGIAIPQTPSNEDLLLRFDHLVDTIYFGNSNESVFLQLADCCAYVVKRLAMGRTDVNSFYEEFRSQATPHPPKAMFSGSDVLA